jgi:pimeloyl-ACP methyl ester carboxylesterase
MPNMNSVQRKLRPEIASLNLLSNWPHRTVPTPYIFGGFDPLVPAHVKKQIADLITDDNALTSLPNAGHMVHFDEPAFVRTAIARAHAVP